MWCSNRESVGLSRGMVEGLEKRILRCVGIGGGKSGKTRLFALVLFVVVVLGFLVPNIPQAEAVTLTSSQVFTSSSSDCWIAESGASYSPVQEATSGTMTKTEGYTYIGQIGPAPYFIYRTALYFDTSTIPADANITSATLSIYLDTDNSDTDFYVRIQNGQPTYPHDPPEDGDYWESWYSGNGGQWLTSFFVVGYVNMSLSAAGESWIQKASETKLMLRSSRDIAATTPTGFEIIRIRTFEAGSSFVPKLYVTYSFEGWHLHVHGPFFESGLAAPYLVNVTLSKENAVPYSFSVNGAGGADTVEINCTTQPVSLIWNITSPSTNRTRTMYLSEETYQDIYVFLPNDDEPYYLYTFTVTDFAGITDGFLETIINVNGTNRIVERQSLDLINSVPFWMTWAHKYDLRITCAEGTYNYGGFIALNEQTQGLIITKDMFPIAQPGMNVTVSARRMNATWIQVNYTDSQSLTYWLNVTIRTRVGYGWATAYSTNNTGQTQQINWYSAISTLDYRAIVTAQRTEQQTWTFNLPKEKASTNPWQGLLDILGTLPFPVAQLVGVVLVVCFAGAFSYINTGLGCVVMCIIAGILVYIGWLDISSGAIGLALTIAIIYVIYEAKKTEREV